MSRLTRRQVRWATVLLNGGWLAIALTASLTWGGRSSSGYLLGFAVVFTACLIVVKPMGLALASRQTSTGDGIDVHAWQLVSDTVVAAHRGNRQRFHSSAARLNGNDVRVNAYLTFLLFISVTSALGGQPSPKELRELSLRSAKQLAVLLDKPYWLEEVLHVMFGHEASEMPQEQRTLVMAEGLGTLVSQPRRWLAAARPELVDLLIRVRDATDG